MEAAAHFPDDTADQIRQQARPGPAPGIARLTTTVVAAAVRTARVAAARVATE